MVELDRSARRAAEWAEYLRCCREQVTGGLLRAEWTLGEVFSRRHDHGVGEIHLLAVLEALPGVRMIDARRWLRERSLNPRTALCRLDDELSTRVLEGFGSAGA